jgi:hypothetical protein
MSKLSNNEFKDMNISTDGIPNGDTIETNREAVEIVNARLRSAAGMLNELGMHPTKFSEEVEAVVKIAEMYERQVDLM